MTPRHPTTPTPRARPRRACPGCSRATGPTAPWASHEHLDRYGPPPLPRHAADGRRHLISTVEAAGLRGRGGAAFPTGRKMRDRRPAPGPAGRRGERRPRAKRSAPRTASLLDLACPTSSSTAPSLAAEAVGADEVIVARRPGRRPAPCERVTDAIEAARAWHASIRSSFRVVALPTRYVAGEETALVNFVNGGLAKPTFTPPRPFERGVAGRPTLIQNVETLAHRRAHRPVRRGLVPRARHGRRARLDAG